MTAQAPEAPAPTETPAGLLPTTRSTPPTDGLLYRRVLLYGAAKLGKTTTANQFTEAPLIIDTEGGAEAYEAFRVPCPDWATFRQIGGELVNGGVKDFTALVVDTADELARQCQEHVIASLAGRENDLEKGEYHHPADFEFGKGWSAVTEEFRLRLGRLCSLGLPVLIISHEREREVKTSTGPITVASPDVGAAGIRKWLEGYVDLILRATVVNTTDGPRHVIQARPSADTLVGGRTPVGGQPLPEYFSLSGPALYRALTERIPQQSPEGKEEVKAGGDGTPPPADTPEDTEGDGQEQLPEAA